MPYVVRLTPEAARQLQLAAEWWQDNRPSAPGLLLAEAERVFHLLATEPGVGTIVDDEEFTDIRRLHASRVRYHVYYRVRGEVVEVVAIWHSSRGEGPLLAPSG